MKYEYDNFDFPSLKSLKAFFKELKYKHKLGRILLLDECAVVLGLFEKFGAETHRFNLVFSDQREEDFGGRQLYALHSRTGEEELLSVGATIKSKNYQR